MQLDVIAEQGIAAPNRSSQGNSVDAMPLVGALDAAQDGHYAARLGHSSDAGTVGDAQGEPRNRGSPEGNFNLVFFVGELADIGALHVRSEDVVVAIPREPPKVRLLVVESVLRGGAVQCALHRVEKLTKAGGVFRSQGPWLRRRDCCLIETVRRGGSNSGEGDGLRAGCRMAARVAASVVLRERGRGV